jgi:choline transporter-like protein 2/4/5
MDGNPVTGEELNESIIRLRLLLELRNFGERVFSDLGDTWWMIGIALIGACILSFVWIILMRWITGIMVWTSITLCTLLFSGLLAYSVYNYVLLKDDPTAGGTILSISPSAYYLQDLAGQRNTWLAIAIVTGVILLVIVMVLIALRQRINIAIELIEQGSKAVGQMCSALTFPAMPFLLHIGVVAWFCVVAMSLSSAGYAEYRVFQEDKNVARSVFAPKVHEAGHDHGAVICPNFSCLNANGSTFHVGAVCDAEEFNSTCPNAAQCTPKVSCIFYKYVRSADATSWMPWYNLFGCYWASFFVSGLGELILAGVFARWYWTRNKNNVPNCSLCRSIYDAFRYHLGTVAFGSLIIAIIRFIRTIVSYVEKKLKLYNNDLTRCLLCCCKCCLYCLERFMRFISRNAYIMTAVKGTNFCSSAKDAFNLLMRNILRVLVLNKMVDFLLFMGKLVIVAGVGVLSYFFFSGNIKEFESVIPKLNYLFTPIVIIVIGSYWIASCFFGVYEMAVDTLFLCFLEDLERNDGSIEKPYFMSKGLQKVLHQMNKYHEDNN